MRKGSGSAGYKPVRARKVVVASRTEEENGILLRKLASLSQSIDGGVRFSTSRPQAARLEVSEAPDLVIFNFNDWNENEIQYVMDLRTTGYREMILILAKADVPTAVQNLKSLENTVYLEKPFETRDLVGIVQKALVTGAVNQQLNRRFVTQQDATVEFRQGKGALSSRIFNMSKTGAYLELTTLKDVQVGETVRLRLELEDVSRTYLMPAKVVWTQVMGRTGGTGLGVTFTGPGDVKKHMFQA